MTRVRVFISVWCALVIPQSLLDAQVPAGTPMPAAEPTPAGTPAPPFSAMREGTWADPLSADYHFKLGLYYHSVGERGKAIEQFKRVVELNPNDSASHLNLGIVYGGAGRLDDALGEFEKAIELNPDNAAAQFNRGVIFMKQGRHGEAISAFEKALILEGAGDPAAVHYNLAVCYEYAGGARYGKGFDAAKSIHHYMKALATRPDSAVIHYNLGVVYARSGDLEGAERELEKASELDPAMADAPLQLGLLMISKRNYHRALRHLLQAQKLDSAASVGPALVEAYGGLGQFYLDNGDHESARQNFEEALRLDSTRGPLIVQLGRAYRGLGKHAESVECFTRALSLDEGLPLKEEIAETQSQWGDALAGSGSSEAAIQKYEEAIRLNPANGGYYRKIAAVYHGGLKNKGKAIYYYRKALAAGLPATEAEKARRELADAARDEDRLVERYRQLVARNPENATLHYNLAVFYQEQENLDGAIEEYKEALKLDPSNSFAHYNLGLVYKKKEMRSAALREYKLAIHHNPGYERAHYALGVLCEELGAYDKAHEEYEKALEIEPDYADAHLALGLLLRNRVRDKAGAAEHLEKYRELTQGGEKGAGKEKKNAAPVAMP
jgi:superkiller protein 3